MSFVNQQQQTNRPGAAIAVVGIHALLGAGLVLGLSGYVMTPPADEIFTGINVDPVDPPPPPPKPTPDTKAKPADSVIYTPPTPTILPSAGPPIGSTDEPVKNAVITPYVPPVGGGVAPVIEPLPSIEIIDPIAASPRNDQSRWGTQGDYNSRWRREEMAGAASFRLGIGTDGRVQSCTITASSGHTPLDVATCKLVTKRARFNAARNSSDELVTGSYSGSVLWQLPE